MKIPADENVGISPHFEFFFVFCLVLMSMHFAIIVIDGHFAALSSVASVK